MGGGEGRCGGGELNFWEGGEVEGGVVFCVQHGDIRRFGSPAVGDVNGEEVVGPLEEEGGRVSEEDLVFCESEGWGGRGSCEGGVGETGAAEGGVVVGVDGEGA